MWNLFIGIGAFTGLILFASGISYESSSKKEIEQIKASREADYEGPYGLESWQKEAHLHPWPLHDHWALITPLTP